MNLQDLPTLNAILNSCSFVSLVVGYLAIKRGRRSIHIKAMIVALAFSAAFLTSYLIYHFHPDTVEVHFPENLGAVRVVYLTVLVTHVVLAVVIVPLIAFTVTRAIRRRFDAHKRLARWTLPLWAYVSVTGVIVYGMLYHLAPALAAQTAAP